MAAGDYLRAATLDDRRLREAIDASRDLWATCTNSSNAYTAVPTIPITSVKDGELYRFIPSATNSGASTLAINNPNGSAVLSAKAIKRSDGVTALVSGDIVNDVALMVQYDTAKDVFRALDLLPTLASLTLASGTYTPSLTNIANLDSVTAYDAQYMRVGTVVTVAGILDVNPTAGAAVTRVGISLPVASDFTAVEHCGGTAFCTAVASMGAGIFADSTNNRAELRFVSTDTSDRTLTFTFTYRIL